MATTVQIHKVRRLRPIKEQAPRLGLTVWGLRAQIYDGKVAFHKIGNRVMVSDEEIERIISDSEHPRTAA